MNEIERKLSIMSNKSRRTRRIVTIAAAGLLIATMLVGASLIGFYYKQTGSVNVTPLITITYNGTENYAGWEETGIIIGAEGTEFYAGETKTIGPYNITYADPPNSEPSTMSVYFHINVTENDAPIDNDILNGLLVKVYDVTGEVAISLMKDGYAQIEGFAPGDSVDFEIRVIAHEHIDTTSTYGYTITMDWNQPE